MDIEKIVQQVNNDFCLFCFPLSDVELSSFSDAFAMNRENKVSIVFASDCCPWNIYEYDWWNLRYVRNQLQDMLNRINNKTNDKFHSWEVYVIALCFDNGKAFYDGNDIILEKYPKKLNGRVALEMYELSAKTGCIDAVIKLIQHSDTPGKWCDYLIRLFKVSSIEDKVQITKLMWPYDYIMETDNKVHSNRDSVCGLFINELRNHLNEMKLEDTATVMYWDAVSFTLGLFGRLVNTEMGMGFFEAFVRFHAIPKPVSSFYLNYSELGDIAYEIAQTYKTGKFMLSLPTAFRDDGSIMCVWRSHKKTEVVANNDKYIEWLTVAENVGHRKAKTELSKQAKRKQRSE